MSRNFQTNCGICQGDALSTALFNAPMEYAMTQVDEFSTNLQDTPPAHRISYVDDNVFINLTPQGEHAICDAAKRALSAISLHGNPDKDEAWSISYARGDERDWKRLNFFGLLYSHV
eukprot:Filipodium_phascolosomae@DN6577_c0_g1_i1.p1